MKISKHITIFLLFIMGCSNDHVSNDNDPFELNELFDKDMKESKLDSDSSSLDIDINIYDLDNRDIASPLEDTLEQVRHNVDANSTIPSYIDRSGIECNPAGVMTVCRVLEKNHIFYIAQVKEIRLIEPIIKKKDDQGSWVESDSCDTEPSKPIEILVKVLHSYKSEKIENPDEVSIIIYPKYYEFWEVFPKITTGNAISWKKREGRNSYRDADSPISIDQVIGVIGLVDEKGRVSYRPHMFNISKHDNEFLLKAQNNAACWNELNRNEVEGKPIEEIESSVRKCEAVGDYYSSQDIENSNDQFERCYE